MYTLESLKRHHIPSKSEDYEDEEYNDNGKFCDSTFFNICFPGFLPQGEGRGRPLRQFAPP